MPEVCSTGVTSMSCVAGGHGGSLGAPGGVRPCQPGATMPEPGSDTTVLPSADTVAVPLMTSRPVVWSKLSTSSCVPGAALKTFGKVIWTGFVNTATPGAWIVMSKLCSATPAGSMSLTSSGGTVAMPIWTLPSGWPSLPTAEPGCTVSVSELRCSSVSLGAATCGVVMTVGTSAATVCSVLTGTRGR